MAKNEFQAVGEITDRAFKLKLDKKYQQARQVLEDGLEEYPDNNYLKTSLADLFIRDNKIQDARNLVEEVLKDDPQNYRALTLQGTLAYKKRNYEQALDLYQQSYSIKETSYIAERLIRTYLKLEKPEQALDLCQQWLEKEEDNQRFLDLKALIYDKMDKESEALEMYQEYLEEEPEDAFAYKQKIKLKLKDKPPEQAVKELRQLIKLKNNKKKEQLYTLLGQTLEDNDRFEEAVSAFKNALELNPGDKFILQRLGFSLVKAEDREQAIKYLKQAFRKDPSDFHVRSSLMSCFKKLNKQEEGIEFFIELINENPGFNNLWGMVNKLKKGLNDDE